MSKLLTRLRGLQQRRRVAREMDDELRFHLDAETDSNIAGGMSPNEARRAALRDLGGVEQTKEAIRDVRILSIDGLLQDARHAVRVMRKNGRFTALAVLTLTLGLGVNIASMAVAYDILVRPLPYREPARLVVLNLLFSDGNDKGFSPETLQAWLPRLHTVDSIAGYFRREVTIHTSERSVVIPAAFVTDQFFDVLGVPAALGRFPTPPDASPAVFSQRALDRLGLTSASTALNTPVMVSGTNRSIGAVLPSDFAFPNDEIGVWLPSNALVPDILAASSGFSKIVARLKPGITIEQIRDEMNRVRVELNPKSTETVSVQILGESVIGDLRLGLSLTLVGALLVLLVACANVVTLFVGRDVARQRELAARMALGARPAQLIRSALVETFLIALLAAVTGTAIGAVTLKLLISQASGSVSGLHRVGMHWPIAIVVAGLTIAVTLSCSVVPVWHAARVDERPFLRLTTGPWKGAGRIRGAMVVVQIALACVLLVGAGLLARTVSTLLRQDSGIQADNAIEAKFALSDVILFDGIGRQAFVRDLVERVRAMPGVNYAGFGTALPLRRPPITIGIRMIEDNRDELRFLMVGSATPGYLRALGAVFLAGRDFDQSDSPTAPIAILSESAARFYFPGRQAVGEAIPRLPPIVGLAAGGRVIGVVRDMKYGGLDSPSSSTIYVPWEVRPLGSAYLMVRTSDDPMRLAPDIRRVARELDPTVPMTELQTLTDLLAQSLAGRRVRAMPAVGFGLLALAVALVGVFAALSAFVAERRRDMAIRLALGASPNRLRWMIAKPGIVAMTTGLVVGLGIGGSVSRMLSSSIYGISPYDPTTFASAATAVAGGGLLMTYLAVRRAHRLNVLETLKND